MQLRVTNLFEARKNRKLMRVLYSLTLRGHSEMRWAMSGVYGEFAKDYTVILVKHKKKIAGWSLILPETMVSHVRFAHFYVARAFRRKGIGTILYNKAEELCAKNMYCSSWDKVSARFFAKNKAKIYGEKWQDTTLSNPMDIYLD